MAELQIGFALHQEPRNKKFREKVIAPIGYTIVEFDAANQETRWMAELSGDDTMKALCQPGEDMHSFMGSRIDQSWTYDGLRTAVKLGNDKSATNIRYTGKFTNLAYQYRVSAEKSCSVARVQYGIDMTLKEAARIHGIYPRTYPGVPSYWIRQIEKTKKLGYVENLAGRRVEVIGDWSRFSKMRWAMESTSINFPIQSIGADQKYLALACTKNHLTKFSAHFLMDMHDGLLYLCPDDKVKEFMAVMQKTVDNLPYQRAWGYTPTVPMPWDGKSGPSWGTLEGWKG
jgi:DNA polymerase-1